MADPPDLEQIFRQHHGRVLASLIGRFGDFELAEDALQEALLAAVERWPKSGIPDNPAGWLTTTARNKAIDRLRRAKTLTKKLELLAGRDPDWGSKPPPSDPDPYPDERLKLIYTCCHPALAREAQVALTLRSLGGLTTEAIADAFLVPKTTMAQRLVRAKRKIRQAGIPFRVPDPAQMAERTKAAQAVLYLIFNEGYRPASGEALIRHDLSDEAIRLTDMMSKLLRQQSLFDPLAETLGLLALMLFAHARREARRGTDGAMIPLDEQARSKWDSKLIERGQQTLAAASRLQNPGPYQLQAAVQQAHTTAKTAKKTDWGRIADLYDALQRLDPSPVITVNRAVAYTRAHGAQAGLDLLEPFGDGGVLKDYVPFHLARADAFYRLDRGAEALAALGRAIDHSRNRVELDYLQRQRAQWTHKFGQGDST